jgi:hypothetical protein
MADGRYENHHHGWYRFPMHYTESKDGVRDGYFNDCGWTAVRFSERQVREQPEACIDLLRQVVSRLRGTSDELHCQVTPEQRWTQQEAVKMEKDLVREKRLHIQSFGMPDYRKDEVEEMLAAQVAVSI